MRFLAQHCHQNRSHPVGGLRGLTVAALALFALTACESPALTGLKESSTPPQRPSDPQKAAAYDRTVAEIRARAAAEDANPQEFPGVFDTAVPPSMLVRPTRNVAELKAELEQIAAARRGANGRRQQELAAREAELRRLVQQNQKETAEKIRENSTNVQ
ncbi:hypothetical protein NYQ83_01295 [Afifella sp. JA880]|uniref:hypothetical protein n=1 Tax=Afifella sp. JA880 TaxID=2975280 RepID=UPI0021BB2DE7|nr:hypothetical protein [Afifella sp. JA880]MCT8265895.1 hypothetical protein [Afifella sp. JA880]